jgi:hypothetical protein
VGKNQEVGFSGAIVLICKGQVTGAAEKLREAHAMLRNKKTVAKSAIIINELRHGGPRIASVLSATEPD